MRNRYSEQDPEHYDRPNRRGSRPRTKERPTYDDAADGVVVTVDRGRFTLIVDDPETAERHQIWAVKARPLGRKGVVVGDRVKVMGDVSGAEGSLARIVEVDSRTTVLRRTADDDDPFERVIVANADQLVVVTSLADPEPRHGLIDRALVAAYDAGMAPLLCLTKADLADPETLLSTYRSLGVPWVVTRRVGDAVDGVDALRRRLVGHTSVLLGHSGVGKSTLVNALVPDADRETGRVNAVTGRGRHTSTSALMLALPVSTSSTTDASASSTAAASSATDASSSTTAASSSTGDAPAGGGWIIDTPGIRSFGLAHVSPDHLIEAFPDLDEMTEDCPRGCTHGAEEPECGLDEAVRRGEADPERVESFRRLLEARSVTTY